MKNKIKEMNMETEGLIEKTMLNYKITFTLL